MFRCYSYTIIRERINLCLLKLLLLKQSIKIHKIHISHTPMYLNFPTSVPCSILILSKFYLFIDRCTGKLS